MTERRFYYYGLAALRSIAAISVFFFHYGMFPVGYLGVDLFLILSGFFVASIVPEKIRIYPAIKLLIRRIKRIHSPLIFFGIIYFVYAWNLLSPGELKETARIFLLSFLGLANYYFSSVDYFAINFQSYPLTHLWSLSVELQFYCIFIFVSVFLANHTARAITWFAILLIVLCYLLLVNQNSNYYLIHSRLWCFALGVLIFYVIKSEMSVNKVLSILIISLLCLGVLLVYDNHPWMKNIIFSFLVCKAMILLIVIEKKDKFKLNEKTKNFVRHLGNISYPFYLLHLPVLFIFEDNIPTLGLMLITYLGAFAILRMTIWFD